MPKSKGTVYGGVCHWPSHPLADMHGLVRAVVLTGSIWQVHRILQRYGVDVRSGDYGRYWSESQSVIERHITESHYGEVFVCSLPTVYLSASYASAPSELLASNRKELPW